ncbi:C-5 cytosine-specific DNA methylase [Podochytrium sp. JEL0797]|nr:C-5 cytosine-specific DNA methylase [Podochytrium sp. JEL0797]
MSAPAPSPAQPTHIRALEFFCGIGGLHYGLQYSQQNLGKPDGAQDPTHLCIEVPAAFDINHVTNEVYEHNFGVKPLQTAIEKLTAPQLDKYNANTWLLSPPCQPFTRGGKKLDNQDPRSKGLLHLINVLPKLKSPPEYLLLENVLNFEVSRSRDILVSTLTRMGYDFEEFLLSPLQFGIPNDRKRYYLTARRRAGGPTAEGNALWEDEEDLVEVPLDLKTEWDLEVPPTQKLSQFLDAGLAGKIGGSTPHMPAANPFAVAKDNGGVMEDVEAFKIPEAFVKKRKFISDGYVVGPAEKKSACFTKAYGHHGIGAGSFLQTKGFDIPKSSIEPVDAVEAYGLRFFSPTEVARLHGFPVPGSDFCAKEAGEKEYKTFTFPATTTLIQRYRVLGNSLSVVVVGELLKHKVFPFSKK